MNIYKIEMRESLIPEFSGKVPVLVGNGPKNGLRLMDKNKNYEITLFWKGEYHPSFVLSIDEQYRIFIFNEEGCNILKGSDGKDIPADEEFLSSARFMLLDVDSTDE